MSKPLVSEFEFAFIINGKNLNSIHYIYYYSCVHGVYI